MLLTLSLPQRTGHRHCVSLVCTQALNFHLYSSPRYLYTRDILEKLNKASINILQQRAERHVATAFYKRTHKDALRDVPGCILSHLPAILARSLDILPCALRHIF